LIALVFCTSVIRFQKRKNEIMCVTRPVRNCVVASTASDTCMYTYIYIYIYIYICIYIYTYIDIEIDIDVDIDIDIDKDIDIDI